VPGASVAAGTPTAPDTTPLDETFAAEELGPATLPYLSALARCASRDDVASAVREHGLTAFNASTVELAMMEPSLELRVKAVAGRQGDHSEGDRIPLDSTHALARAARSGAVQLAAGDGQADPGPSTYALPLRAPDGRGVIGALAVTFPEPIDRSGPPYRHLFLAEETAWALDRGRLIESERKMRVRAQNSVEMLSRLQAVTAGLLGARQPEDVADVIVATGVRELGAENGTMYLQNGTESPPVPIRHLGSGAPPDATEAGSVASTVMRTGKAMFIPSVTEPTGDAPAGTTLAVAAVPIQPRNRAAGAIVFRFRDKQTFSDLERSALAALAGQCAQALERAQLYAERTEEARLLQQHLLPARLPTIPGVEAAVRYRPFGDGSMVGGDFYDIFPVDRMRWGFTIGDVCGKGIPAASLTALARHAIRALATSEDRPSEILRRVNEIVLQESLQGVFCTVVQGFLWRSEEGLKIRFAIAGHPRPILVSASGQLEPVGSYGSLIGVFGEPQITDDEITVRPNETFVLYTDGVAEARSPEGLVAPDLLERAVAAAAGRPAEEMARAVETAALQHEGGTNRDDMALLVLRVTDEAVGDDEEALSTEGERTEARSGA
jgi:serine phosphatase RsbU (regulator of sigma subunit)